MKNVKKKMMIFVIITTCMMMMSACGERTSTTITLVPNFSDAAGAKVTLTNNSGDKSHVYQQTAKGTTVDFRKIAPGSYTLTVEGEDIFSFTQNDITVHSTVAGYTANLFKKGPGGGYVFYDKGDDSDGWRYLEAAPASSEFDAQWGVDRIMDDDENWVWIHFSGTQTAIGTGNANTQIINATLRQIGKTGYAAQMCSALNINGFNDWFLPSLDELNLMYENLHKKGSGDFGKGTNSFEWLNWSYWSSSCTGGDASWTYDFYNGSQGEYEKNDTRRVRAIRAF